MPILFIEDFFELRKRKEQELSFYHEELEKLRLKMLRVQKEIDLTSVIIDIIEGDRVVDIREVIKRKQE